MTFLRLSLLLLTLLLSLASGCGEKIHKLELAEYYKEVDIDPRKAEKKYEGSRIELTARVWSIGISEEMPGYPPTPTLLVLKRPDLDISDLNSDNLLVFLTKDPQPWKRISPGGTVTVRGRCDQRGGSMVPVLADCEILAATGDPVPFITVEQMAKEYKADPEAAKKKFDKASEGIFEPVMIVEGEITSIDGPDDYHMHLKTDNEVKIAVSFSGIGWQNMHKKFKVGDRAQFIGTTSFYWKGGDILILTSQGRMDPK